MPEDSNQPPQAAVPEKPSSNSVDSKEESVTTKKQRRGLISRIWNGIFRVGGDDYEKRLQHISKEEDSVRARMKRRSQSKKARNLIILSFILEVFAIGYAIMTTRSLALDWKMRALRVLPMFVLPVLSSASYSILVSFTRMYQRRDQKTLDRLRAERQAKIDELKERSNYYRTQQLIERYDPDPAAKAAAATILASKLGADSGLKVYLGDESKLNPSSGKSNDVEFIQSKGMRNRKQSHARSSSTGCVIMQESAEEVTQGAGYDGAETLAQNQTVVEHHPNSTTHDGGWIARIAALLVGEDPAQSYALICGNCHMHNGLARKEDFAYITYYCPHCHALNRSREHASVSSSSNVSCPATPSSVDGINNVSSIILKDSNLMTDSNLSTSNPATPLEAAMGVSETEVAEGPEN